jgi:eukaryotic translation initiation factor 2-alpha kinase 4
MDLLHRDLKPANIFLDSKFDVKLGDFGLAQKITQKNIAGANKADIVKHSIFNPKKNRFLKNESKEKLKLIQQSLRKRGHLPDPATNADSMITMGIGTYYYMSPEQETQMNYNQKTDMFSLGIIIFEMYAGMRSVMERDKAFRYIRTNFKVPPEYFDKIHKNAVAMIEKLVSQNPDDRPNADELLKNEFVDPENNASNISLVQYTYYLDYPDFKYSFDLYNRYSEVLNIVNKE